MVVEVEGGEAPKTRQPDSACDLSMWLLSQIWNMYSVPPLLGTLEGLRRFPGAALSRVKNKVDIPIPGPLYSSYI
jgi:hypothetical protein